MEGGQQQDQWELSKENIQPLKQGRSVMKLNNALEQHKDDEVTKVIAEERQQFEEELRSYSGDDPLDPWYRYIQWVEQTYPKGGKEGQVHVIIEKCIKKFKGEPSVQDDQRFLDIWLKYAAMSSSPLDVFDFMYKQGVCTKQAGLYEAWAYQLELLASYKKADSVFTNGLKAVTDADVKARLQGKQKQFQARVLRRVKGEEVAPEETEEEERSALGQLRGHGKKGKVGSVRVGQAKLGGPGVLPSKQPLKDNNKQQGGGFQIFQDENAPRVALAGPGGGGVRLPSTQDRKENEQKAGTWGAVKGSSRMGNVPLKQADQHKPAFVVHQDEGVQQPVPPSPHIGTSKVLSTRKEETAGTVHCPVALFEPADPTKRAMYCKDKVYQGATEFSFEELQASRWKRQEKIRLEKEEMERKRLELLEMEQRMDRKMEEMQRLMALQQNVAAAAAQAPALCQPGIPKPNSSRVNDPSLALRSRDDLTPSASCESSLSTSSSASLQRKHSMDDTAYLMAANPTGARNRSQGRTPSPHGSKAPCWSQPSPTVNTREAMAEVQQMWRNASVAPDPSVPALAPAPFAIFSDENAAPPPTAQSAAPFPIFCDENAPPASTAAAPFPIFSDENAEPQRSSKAAAAPFTIFSDEKQPEIVKLRPRLASKSEVNEAELENQENLPPKGYAQPARGAREVGGVLTQAEGVEWMPLEEQERLLDEDERRQEEDLGLLANDLKPQPSKLPKPSIQANQTIALPNEDDFERMAKLSSTPHTGRAFQVEQDENTCAVDIVYRQAMGPPAPPSEIPEEPSCQPAQGSLSPIVETSREYYRSSSSSGSDTLHSKTPHGDKSHWGNTQHQVTTTMSRTRDATTASLSRTPGHFLAASHATSGYMGDKSCAISGYMGDKSGNLTKSGVKQPQFNLEKRELSTPNRPQSYDKKLKLAAEEEEMEDEEEPTGMFTDMMAEFKQGLGAKPKAAEQMGRVGDIDTSLQVSMVGELERERTRLETSSNFQASRMAGITSGNITGVANMTSNMTGLHNLTNNHTGGAPPGLNITPAPPSLDLTGLAAPGLDMTAAPNLDLTSAPPTLNLTTAPSTTLNGTGIAPPPLDLTEGNMDMGEELASQTANLSLEEDLDPFAPSTHEALLAKLPPLTGVHGYVSIGGAVPNVRTKSLLTLGEDVFYVSECKGEGGFAKVFAASKQETEGEEMNSTISGIDAVLKVQKPANDWEWYVCREVGLRVAPSMRSAFMSSPRNYSYANGSIFVSYHQKLGSMLDIVNITKTCGVQKSCIEPMAIYFTIEMLGMVDALHKADILHADIKADNFLLQGIPLPNQGAKSADEMFKDLSPALQLIDFGKSIDLRLLPKNILFTKVVKTDGLTCPEMREGTGWREHLDYFGVAATAYLLLFTTYMDIVKLLALSTIHVVKPRCIYIDQVGDRWEAKGSFKRWWNIEIWKEFFAEFLNIQGDKKEDLPDLMAWRTRFQQLFFEKNMARSLEKLKQDVSKGLSSL